MKPVCWGHLLPDPLTMRRFSADDLDAIERAAECEAMTVGHGIAAIGELLANLPTIPPAISAGCSNPLATCRADSLTWLTVPSTN